MDFCSGDIVFKCIEIRFIDLDIHMDRRKNIIIANGLNMGGWILTLNDILFKFL